MKKKLDAKLISIAHRIIKLEGKDDIIEMHAEVKELYETLSVLKFAHENFKDDLPTIGNDSSFFGMLDTAFNNKLSDTIEVEDKIYINLDEKQENEITEPLMETIKDMVAQMPGETHKVDDMLDDVLPVENYRKNDLDDLTSGFKDTPIFDPISRTKKELNNNKKSLNDKIKPGGLSFNIGLNDKIAFIKHLFDGQKEDYDRVLSQLNTLVSYDEVTHLINDVVKPDYNNWKGKEEFEERFMYIIESKFI